MDAVRLAMLLEGVCFMMVWKGGAKFSFVWQCVSRLIYWGGAGSCVDCALLALDTYFYGSVAIKSRWFVCQCVFKSL